MDTREGFIDCGVQEGTVFFRMVLIGVYYMKDSSWSDFFYGQLYNLEIFKEKMGSR